MGAAMVDMDAASVATSASTNWTRLLVHAVDGLSALLLGVNLVIVLASVFYRYFLHDPFEWADEGARALLVALTFVGAASGISREQHAGIEAVLARLPVAWREYAKALGCLVIIAVSAALAIYGILLARTVGSQETAAGFPQVIFVYPVAIGGIWMVIFGMIKLSGYRLVTISKAFAGAIALSLLAWSISHVMLADLPWVPLALMAGAFIVSLLAGIPIAFALGFSSLVYLWTNDSIPVEIFAQQSAAGVDNFVLLAVPFFILTGYIMEVNGMSVRLIEMIQRAVGQVRGGLHIVMVLSMIVFSGISGSKLADVAAVGSVLVPAARKSRQNPSDAVALLAASAVVAETIPPCVNLIILGFVANISISGLFLAGIVPAIALSAGLIVLSMLMAPKQSRVDLRIHPEVSRRDLWLSGVACIGMLLVIFVGYRSGFATATEISAFAALYALVVGGVIFRDMSLGKIYRVLVKSAGLAGMVLFIIALAQTLAFILTINQVPHAIAEALISMGQHYGRWSFVVFAILTLIVMGAVLEGAAALIIFGPMLVPVATQLGLDPLHFGTLLVLSMGVGLFAPPLGLGLYACCAVGQVSIESVTRSIGKYFALVFLGILLVAFAPEITLALPRHFGLTH
jgi:tripartite ATP-independent transporter DctM subunit